LEHTVDYFKGLVNPALLNNQKKMDSWSLPKYLKLQYSDAPMLEKVEEYLFLEPDKNFIKFVENIISAQFNNKLISYLSDFIILIYKKDKGEKNKQSIWNSDVSRLTYQIKEPVDKNGISNWYTDKSGIKTSETIIEEALRIYITNFDAHYGAGKSAKIINQNTKLNPAIEIIGDIENNKLVLEILKYIAPHFYLKKKGNAIQ
jgi:hypothetical protein